MRGKVYSCHCGIFHIGITPAYAGKSREYFLGMKSEKGSPPPMRGKAEVFVVDAVFARITPAYAGKRSSFSMLNRREQDHPRLCGEKQFLSEVQCR